MKCIDFIIKNFQAKAFIQDLKNEIGEGWCEDAVLKNFIDYNDLEYQLNYLKLFKGDITKKIDEYKKKNFNQTGGRWGGAHRAHMGGCIAAQSPPETW